MLKYVIGFTAAALLGFLSVVAIYLGVLAPVEVQVQPLERKHLVFQYHVGPYHKIGLALEEVQLWVKAHDSQMGECQESFGEFLLNPKEVDAEHLRSHVGCVVEQPVTSLPPNWEYKMVEFERGLAVHFTGSPSIGPWKVYPKMEAFMKERGWVTHTAPFEFYTITSNVAFNTKMTTLYYWPLTSEGSFLETN